MRRPSRNTVIGLVAALVLLGSLAAAGWITLFRAHPDRTAAASIEDRYKYGSVGTEAAAGVPYWIWLVLPRVFPEHLPGPGGYLSVGLVWEEGQETPVGITKLDIGIVPRAGVNCALCHAGTYRTRPDQAVPTVVPGAASTRFDALAYQTFLIKAGSDPRFTAEVLMPEIRKIHRMNPLEDLLYKLVLIPMTRRALLEIQQRWAWAYRQPPWGPGRIDPFNPVKFGVLKQPLDATIGHSDMMPLLGLGRRTGQALHWDGLNSSVREVVLSSAIGDGATEKSLPVEHLAEIERYLQTAAIPPHPFPIDQALADRGKALYDTHCAGCHQTGQGRTGQVIPVEEVGTDRHRIEMWEAKDAAAYNERYRDQRWGFRGFQNVQGYVAVPLDGLWLRGPYLHNGSVPSLAALLEPPEKRPAVFYRGNDLYDPSVAGFVSDQPSAGSRKLFRYDTAVPGNSNRGHLYGVTLPAADKAALLEHLKRL